MDEREELYLTDLISVDILQRLQDAFSDLTGMAALTTDKYGVPVTKGSNFSDFCMKYTRKSPLGKAKCMECDKRGAEQTLITNKACFYHCHAGLVDYAAPIIANGKMIGSFIGGQVLSDPPDLKAFEMKARELGICPELYVEAVKKINIVDNNTIDKASRFLRIVAECLSHIAYQGYELHKSNIEIERNSHLKSDFLANMSHEIRTPMNAVMGMVDLALREEMSDPAREYISQIKQSAKNLLVIINDILDFSKIESGKMDIIDVAYEPLSIVNDLGSIAKSKIGSKEIEFTMNVVPDMPQTLYGDNVRIHQILLNLITNAVKFTQRGEVHLDFRCERESDDVVIMKAAITDTGIGIKQDDFKKLFNSFQQVDSKRNRNIEGTGLGLVICKQLLELMGGNITVESEYGKGSTFSFTVPQKIVDSAVAIPKLKSEITAGVMINNPYARTQMVRDLEWIGAKAMILNELHSFDELQCDYIIVAKDYFTDSLRDYLSENKNMKCIIIAEFGEPVDIYFPNVKILHKPVFSLGLYNAMGLSEYELSNNSGEYEGFTYIAPDAHILIVDDNAINLKVAKGLIEPLEMDVDTADSASRAIEMVVQKKYDLIFMDHMMPEVDGVEATHIIRRMLPSYKETPIIALTANAVGDAKDMFIREGMSDFVAKPIEVRDIVSKIKRWLPQEKIIPSVKYKKTDNKNDADKLNIEGLNIENAVRMLGSEELFKTVLKDYYTVIDERVAKLNELRDSENWEVYTIEVHSLKSTSNQIGAETLGALAAELEMAGKSGNYALIKEKHGALIEQYMGCKDLLRLYFDGDNEQETDGELNTLLDEIIEAMDSFDILAIDEALEKIGKSVNSSDDKQRFKELRNAADESDFERCIEIVNEWKDKASKADDTDSTPSDEFVMDMLDKLKNALNDFDILLIDEAVEMLDRYKYPQQQQELLTRIKECAELSDLDSCCEAADKWYSIIS